MKIKSLLAGGIASAMIMTTASASEGSVIEDSPSTGSWYTGAYLGPSYIRTLGLKFDGGGGGPFGTELEPDRGYSTGLTFGYAYATEADGSRWRVEIELAHSKSDITHFSTFAGPIGLIQNGDITQQGLMINGYRDFADWGSFTPYLGFGLGIKRTKIDLTQGFGASPLPGFILFPISNASHVNWGLAYQAMAGLEYEITDNWSAYGEFRVTGMYNQDFDLGNLVGSGPTVSVEDNIINTSILLGVKYSF